MREQLHEHTVVYNLYMASNVSSEQSLIKVGYIRKFNTRLIKTAIYTLIRLDKTQIYHIYTYAAVTHTYSTFKIKLIALTLVKF